MSERRLRAVVGLGVVAAHLFLVALVCILTTCDRFDQPEMFTILGVIGPLLAAYATVCVRRLMLQDPSEISPQVGMEKVILGLAIPSFYFLSLCGLILWKAFGSLHPDSLVKLIGLAETFIGVYLGIIVEHMFIVGRSSNQPKKNDARASS
jgi:hypothetical protein